jgi:hypothetical protein
MHSYMIAITGLLKIPKEFNVNHRVRIVSQLQNDRDRIEVIVLVVLGVVYIRWQSKEYNL